MAKLLEVDWKLQLTISRQDVISLSRINSFIGNIRELLKQWPREVSEQDLERLQGFMHEINRLKRFDDSFIEAVKQFTISEGNKP